MTLEILQRLALALAIGLLIGIERGWRERDRKEGGRAAGIRTHTLIGLFGGIWGLVGQQYGDLALGLGAAAFIAGFVAFEWREGVRNDDLSATGFVAGVLTFAFGVYVMRGDMLVTAAAAVVTTFVLAERELFHGFLARLRWVELRHGLLLLVMTVVLLPLLPDAPVDPWGALNPFEIWLATVSIAALSFGGYIAVRIAGPEKGPLFAGLAGGLISSTTVTWTFARRGAGQPNAQPLAAGIAASWAVSLARITVVAVAIAPSLLPELVPPVGIAVLVLIAAAFLLYRRGTSQTTGAALELGNPFDLLAVLQFGALIAVILLLSTIASARFGTGGLFGLAAITGLADVDPVTVSVAQMTGGAVSPGTASLVILTAALANLVAKCVLALSFGSLRFAAPLLASAGIAVLAGLPLAVFL